MIRPTRRLSLTAFSFVGMMAALTPVAFSRRMALPAILALLAVSAPGCSAEGTSADSDLARGSIAQKPPTVLKGGIQHSEKLPPAPDYLQEGRKLDDKQFQKLTPSNYWFQVPSFMAGRWKEGEFEQVRKTDLKTGDKAPAFSTRSAQLEYAFGAQIDKAGQIWEYRGCPYNQKVVTASHKLIGNALTTRYEALTPGEGPFKIIREYTSTDLEGATGTISSCKQIEQIQTFAPRDDNSFHFESSSREFDSAGAPVSQKVYWQIYTRLSHFKQVNTRDGKDLRKLFREYLSSHGLSDRIPD